MDLETFIHKHDEQIPSSATSFRQSGTIFEGGRLNDFIYQFKKPNKMCVELKLDRENSYFEGYNGEKAWEMHQYLLGDPAIALEYETIWPNPIRGLSEFREDGHNVVFLGTSELHDEEYYFLELTIKAGPTREYYFDKNTLQPRYHREVRKLHPAEKPKEMETVYMDYRQVDDAWFAFHVFDRFVDEDEALVDIQWTYAIVDPVIEPHTFDKLSR